jgi:hypothetical protein
MNTLTTQHRGTLVAGAVLIIIGIVALGAGQLALHVDWPIVPIVVGIGIIAVAIVAGGDAAVGFAALGGMVTMAGLVIAFQEATGLWASWPYAWALVVPGGVGVGLVAFGFVTGRPQHVRGGLGALVAGIAIFLVLFLFFEGTIGLNDAIDDEIVSTFLPAALLGFGLVLVGAAFLLPLVDRRTETPLEPLAVGATESAEAWSAPDAVSGAIPLGEATAAEVAISFGAGRLAIDGAAAPGRLVEGSFTGGVRRDDVGPGRVKLTTPTDRIWSMPWDRPPFDWHLGLTAEVPLRLSIETGAAQVRADLSALRVSDLRVKAGAADTTITLPHAAGVTRVEAEGGAAALRISIPEGVAAAIRGSMALGSIDVDEARFPRDTQGGWASPDYAAATDRVELKLAGGLGSISVR